MAIVLTRDNGSQSDKADNSSVKRRNFPLRRMGTVRRNRHKVAGATDVFACSIGIDRDEVLIGENFFCLRDRLPKSLIL